MKTRVFSSVCRCATLSLLAVMGVACMENVIDTQADVEDQFLIDALSEYVVKAASPDVITFNISSTTPWFIESDQQWCSVSPSMSAISSLIAEVTVTIDEYSDVDSRTATLLVTADGITPDLTIEIVQSGAVVFYFTSVDDLLDAAGDTATFTVTSSNDWTITSDMSWLTLDTAGEDGSYDAATVTATATANSSISRSAIITISNGDDEDSFEITQDGVKLSISSAHSEGITPTFSAEGETRSYTIDSTFSDWELTCEDSSVVITKQSDTEVDVTIPANYGFFNGTMSYDFSLTSNSGSVVAATNLVVYQSSNIDLSALSSQYTLGADGELNIVQTTTTGNARFLTNNLIGMGTYTWKMRDVSLSTGTYIKLQAWSATYPSSGSTCNYYLNLVGGTSTFGVGGDLYEADGNKWENPKFWFSAQTFTTVSDLNGIEELVVSILPLSSDDQYTEIIVSVDGTPVFTTTSMQNIWKIDSTFEGLPFYFGLVSTVTGSSATIESFTVEPYEN